MVYRAAEQEREKGFDQEVFSVDQLVHKARTFTEAIPVSEKILLEVTGISVNALLLASSSMLSVGCWWFGYPMLLIVILLQPGAQEYF